MNPFDEVFSTAQALEYLNKKGHKISRITLIRKHSHVGRLLSKHLRIYFKPELDAFLAGQDYVRDDTYESGVLDQLYTVEQASEYLGIHQDRVRHIASQGRLSSQPIGRKLFFIQSWLDTYRQNTRVGRPRKDQQ